MNVTRNLTVNVSRNAATAFAAIVVLVSMITFGSNHDRPLSADASSPQDLAEFGSADGAGGPDLPSVSAAATVLQDGFNRADSPTVGFAWVELEEAGSSVSIVNNKLFFDTATDGINRPLIRRTFTPAVSTGTVQWDFDVDWTRTGPEAAYRFMMQLGNNAAMNDNSQDAGTGVNLVWTKINGVDQRLGYRQGTTDTFLAGLSGPAHITVVANLNSTPKTYSVAVNSSVIQSNIPFFSNVTSLNTVRFLTDNLHQQNIAGRTVDNLVVFSSDAGGNTPPVTQTQSVTTNANTPLTVTLTATDTQQCQLVFNIVTGPANGSLGALANQPCVAGSPNSDTATVVYTPNAGYTGSDSFTWRASDGQVFSSNASVNITVAGGSETVLFSDNFNRGNIAAVGNSWVEVEQAEATVSIGNNQLFFDNTSDAVNRPLVRHGFSPVSTGTVRWDLDFNWTRTGNEGTYRFLMQLGNSTAMNDNSQNGGAGVNLIWTSINGIQESLGYRQGSIDTALSVVSGSATISVVANLDNRTYSVAVNGSTVGSVIPFDANVTSLNTVRFLTDNLNDANISGRTIDNLSVSSSGTPPGNVAPVAHNQAASTLMNQSVALQLSYTDNDGPGPFNFTILTQPANGSLSGSGANRTYTPNNGFTGTNNFTWRVNDGLADSNTATFTLTVNAAGGPLNLQPVNGQTNVSTAPTLEIGCSPTQTNAAQYQISANSAFSSLAYDSGENINDICNHVAFAGLNTNTSYFWRGRIRTGSTWSPYSQPTSFTTVSTSPVNNVFRDGGVNPVCGDSSDTVTADADIRGSGVNPTQVIREWNQGCQDVIRTGRRLPNQATDEIFRSLVQFDIEGGLTNPNAVINAYIELTGWHHTDSNHLFHAYNSMYELNKPWGEGNKIQDEDAGPGEVSWSYTALPNQWGIPGAASASDTNPNADRSATPLVHRVTTNMEGKKSYWSSKNLVDAVKGWISNPASNQGVFIKADDESSQETLHQASKENLDINFRPKLVIVSTESAVNGAPVAQNQSVNTGVNQPLGIVLAFTDPDGPGPYVFTIQSQPSNGVLSGSGANRTYTPNNNFTGTDSFTWRVNDGLANSNTATVNITVAQAGPILSDNFNRANSNTVGGGWSEVEPAGTSAAIANQKLFFAQSSDIANRPLVKRSFSPVSTGTLQWDFEFDWTRIGAEGIYSFLMQLGSGMSDTSQNGGAGVNLIWTSIGGNHQSLGFRQGNNVTLLTEVSGPAQIRVVANLVSKTYSVAVNGTVIQSNIAFDSNVPLDTVRYFTDGLNEANFAGRTIDNVTITGP
jgi:hypothetical protein